MAAEESSQGAVLGPEISDPARGDPPAKPGVPDLNDVLGEFMEALCVIDVVSRVLNDVSCDRDDGVGSCALVLKRGYQMLDAAYTRFDEALVEHQEPGADHLDEFDDDPDDQLDRDDDRPVRDRGRAKKRAKRKVGPSRKPKGLALVA